LSPPAAKRAGQLTAKASLGSLKVTRSACLISPEFASAALASSGVIGRPAASADDQSCGRMALERRSHAAVEEAYHWPETLCAKKLSHRRQAPFSTTSTWRSTPQLAGPPQLPPSDSTLYLGNGKRRWLEGTWSQLRTMLKPSPEATAQSLLSG
jgi:hypothetical protein